MLYLMFSDAQELTLNFPNEGGSDCGLFSIASLGTGFDPADLQ